MLFSTPRPSESTTNDAVSISPEPTGEPPDATRGRRRFLTVAALGAVAASSGGALLGKRRGDGAGERPPHISLERGNRLWPGQYLISPDGQFRLVMQADGDLAIVNAAGVLRWHTGTGGQSGAQLALLANHDLVLLSSRTVLWKAPLPAESIVLLNSGTVAGLRENAAPWFLGPAHIVKPATTTALAALTAATAVPSARFSSAPSSTRTAPPSRYPTSPTGPSGGASSTTTVPTHARTIPPRFGQHPGSLPTGRPFALHLLNRATFGVTPTLEADVAAAGGTDQWLEQQLAPSTIADPVADSVLTRFPNAFVDPPTAQATFAFGAWDGMFALGQATLARQIWSKRQLFEVMVDFWSNHLNITTPSSEPWDTKMWDDAHVIRAHALGRVDEMLLASTHSPAMLMYLSNALSQGTAPNENYGREFLELHTVGVDAGYSHNDVINVARTFSGFTTWNKWNGGVPANYGTFRYLPAWHYVGPVNVLGWSHPNAGAADGPAAGESLVRYLASHPATARHIATKLATRFVSDTPPAALLDRLSQVYLANQTAVIPVLKALFASSEFAASVGAKTRRPTEDLIGTVRTLGVQPDSHNAAPDGIGSIYWLSYAMGDAPLAWDPPNGYPDVAAAWSGAGVTLARWNAHMAIAGQWTGPGLVYPALPDYLLGAVKPTTRSALIDALVERLLPGQNVTAGHRAALIAFLGPDGAVQSGDLSWQFPVLVAMVLDSPYSSVR